MNDKQLKDHLLEISQSALKNEQECASDLLDFIGIDVSSSSAINTATKRYIEIIRSSKKSYIDNFLQEFSLSTDEGVAIMCLAESLLRIPDRPTSLALIEDKLKDKDWLSHLHQSRSFLVNASSWGLLLTGKVTDWASSKSSIAKSLNKLGRPIILKAIKQAVKIMSNTYILGNNLEEALVNAQKPIAKGYKISFDILGESSRTSEQAEFYYQEYIAAIKSMSAYSDKNCSIYNNHNLSIKLTALHPKVLYRKSDALKSLLLPKLKHIALLCHKANISISFDAEEAYRQDIYLEILTMLVQDQDLKNFHGIGFVLQAYQKRTFTIIDYVAKLAKDAQKQIPIRLVKGAYWDGEIKLAQEMGLAGYPVFTRKEFTDLSYIGCAQKILSYGNLFYPQFATHNAQTVATIIELARGAQFEFQRLQGMGESLHNALIKDGFASRIYAPVGKYEELLAYLMRRLLENGSNSSFVNLVSDKDANLATLAQDPIQQSKFLLQDGTHNALAQPSEIYKNLRSNSMGYDTGYRAQYQEITKALDAFTNKTYEGYSIVDGHKYKDGKSDPVFNPAQNSLGIGASYSADQEAIKLATEVASKSFKAWSDTTTLASRVTIIRKIATLLQEHRHELYYLLTQESGKTIDDCIAEVREAIDFIQYYTAMAEQMIASPITLPGYTGENNKLRWCAKGIFVCISPWNFPLAIYIGQIVAALVTGNTVIAKPAGNSTLVATFAAELFYQAGVPHQVFQLLIAGGSLINDHILTDPRIKGVCFTGSTSVALTINRTLANRINAPIATIIAETGGQNAMIVDSSALLEQAADSIIYSSFGSSGQRCSALRVVYVQEEIADKLIHLLVGHMNELKVGNTIDPTNDVGPVISMATKANLEQHIESVQKVAGCSLIARHRQHDDASLNEGSYVVPHIFAINKMEDLERENFGPILHIIKYQAEHLDSIIDQINATGYGLTFGVQTRIEERINYISEKMHVGNVYANRTTTGAQVGTHPFGGENNSGTGFKAGGPHYLYKFMNERVVTINTTAIGGNLDLLKS